MRRPDFFHHRNNLFIGMPARRKTIGTLPHFIHGGSPHRQKFAQT
jgi:hypothetical protein